MGEKEIMYGYKKLPNGIFVPSDESVRDSLQKYVAKPWDRYKPRDGEISLFKYALKSKQPLMLVGPPGTGKSLFTCTMAKLENLPFVLVPFAEGTTLAKQVQSLTLLSNGGDVHLLARDGPVATAVRSPHGAVLYFNEVRKGDGDQLAYYHELLTPQRIIELPESKEVIKLHDRLIVVADYNPGRLEGSNELSPAFARRFLVLRFMPLSVNDAKEFAKERYATSNNRFEPDESYFESLRERLRKEEKEMEKRAELLDSKNNKDLREKVIEGVIEGVFEIRKAVDGGSLLVKELPSDAALHRAIEMLVNGFDVVTAMLTSVINPIISDLDPEWQAAARAMLTKIEGKLPAEYLKIAGGKWPYT